METIIKTVSMPKDVWEEIDEAAKLESRTRSEFLRQSATNSIIDRKRWERIYAVGERQAKKLGIKEEDVERIIAEYRAGK